MPAVHATFTLEKTYPHPVAKVFAAFADPAIKMRWFKRGGEYQSDFRVGGMETASWVMGPDTPIPGVVIASTALYLDIVPDSRIVMGSNMMRDGTPFSGSLATFEFEADGTGTRLSVVHNGVFFEGADGPAMRENGWRELLAALGAALDA
jgi:uncharacterized protein YndB with AHSA1/START domain